MSDRDDKGRFPPGHCGNPAGRPKSSRNRLSEAFIAALGEDFDQHGAATIIRMREEDPAAYVKVVASLLPKQLSIQSEERELTDVELERRIRQTAEVLGLELIAVGQAPEAGGGKPGAP